MTVRELIQQLQALDPDATVLAVDSEGNWVSATAVVYSADNKLYDDRTRQYLTGAMVEVV